MLTSELVSFNELFHRRGSDQPPIREIEIPQIQRDYAQGRTSPAVHRIRALFLDAIYDAVTGESPLALDFVYGENQGGVFHPLDGQQRLTTLFLLHWYIAARANALNDDLPWKNFSYTTRPSARLFCERIVQYQPTGSSAVISEEIRDQPWFLHNWRNDPTIESMLVMIDAMHDLFGEIDCGAAWQRLIDRNEPAIAFYLLPINEAGFGEDLYIKMNSRGKPLTPFENFKARFGQLIERSSLDKGDAFAHQIDGRWLDVFWQYRGDAFNVDDKILRYVHFVTEICAWSQEVRPTEDLDELTIAVFRQENASVNESLTFLFAAFEAWVDFDVVGYMNALFRLPGVGAVSRESGLTLFPPFSSVDLLASCLSDYGEMRGAARKFSWPSTLLLYAVLLNRIHATKDFSRQLRIIRNLIEASSNELRFEKMPALLADVRRIVVDGTLEGCSAFNQAQVDDEVAKEAFLAANDDLRSVLVELEDHRLLRGNLAAFELDQAVFARRSQAFHRFFLDEEFGQLTGAILSIGDYSRRLNNERIHLFGSVNPRAWFELLAGTGREKAAGTRATLGRFLDEVSASANDVSSTLNNLLLKWLAAKGDGSGYDWRWYFVKYPIMRDGLSGKYVGDEGRLGYSICMLDKHQMNSNYRDAYLSAIHVESGVGDAVAPLEFTGHETRPRWMVMAKSGIGVRSTFEGFELRAEPSEGYAQIKHELGVDDRNILSVKKVSVGGAELDAVDRVQVGADLLRKLVRAGL
ncbi:DUF262 domain-containing protein [Bradyrhizobium sp. AUGA SZCCT0042]|uniref:DUF262 domain-containing protein n=1 Tax=Bradyrhizobium sp. AUGA SZCCT0042 TaxID=2807651 RepID=UPI001BA47BB9|nr:DUF262 domain-containing protein [Bradyrhizobium sp. AUGA SZCCT0042]MBR1296628.1 DUF262 domain-containing protein [Bradyrhizobium sp. AUGA SZCCT0042]